MGSVPGWLLRSVVTVQPYAGDGLAGPTYGTSYTAAAYVEDKRRLVRDRDGAEVISQTLVILAPTNPAVPAESLVTVWAGTGHERTARVIASAFYDGAGLPTPDHLELSLS